jgi:hypothetical protein
MKKVLIISAFVFALLILTAFSIRFLLGGSEDTWICQSGEWVKHGNPSAPKPVGKCGPKIVTDSKEKLDNMSICNSMDGNSLNYEKAKEVAIKDCKDGKLKDAHFCNTSTGTWWIDFDPNEPKEGCNPACVVFVDTGKTEINWRCTGLRQPLTN